MDVVQAFGWIMSHVLFVLFTSKDTKVPDQKTPNFVLFVVKTS